MANTTTTDPLEQLFEAADNHAEDAGDFDHAVGDLQDILREAWGLMTIRQRRALLNGTAVEEVLEAGSREEFSLEDLHEGLSAEMAGCERQVTAAGYTITQEDAGFSWRHGATEAGAVYGEREEAVDDAARHLRAE